VKWTQLISADFSLQILGILAHLSLGGFFFHVSFSKRAECLSEIFVDKRLQ